jgi:hypothetical protein
VVLFIFAISNFILDVKQKHLLVSAVDQYRLVFGENTDQDALEG